MSTSVGNGERAVATEIVADQFEEETTGYTRSPSDVLRVIAFTLATVLLVALAKWARDAVLGLESDFISVFSFLSAPVERVLAGLLTMLALLAVLFNWITPLVIRRYRLFGYVAAGNAITTLVLAGLQRLVDRGDPEILVNELAQRAGVDTAISVAAIGQVTSSFVIWAPFVSRRWRRAGALVLSLIVALRLLVSVTVPSTLFVALTVGAAAGSAVLLMFGRPSTRPTRAAVAASLVASGLPVAALERASVDARGSVPYFVMLEDGSEVFAKVLGSDERAADLLFRAYRFLRLKNVGDERPFSSLRRTVEHEALVALMARDLGVRTPRLRAVAGIGRDSLLLSYDRIEGRSLDQVPDEAITDDVLHGIWEQAALLRRTRIAHRDLRTANLFLDTAGRLWLIDFSFSEIAASQALLDADVAQLLVALALRVGPQRTVSSAVAGLGPDAVAAALPRLQPHTFSGATQADLKGNRALLGEVRDLVVEQTGTEPPELEELERINAKMVFTTVMLVAVTYFLLPQLADLPDVWENVRKADWAWFPAILLMSALTYVGAGLAITGSVPDRLRVMPTLACQVASSFASKLAPAAVGGMALNVRYMQREGVSLAAATSAVGLNAVGGFAVHLGLLVVFALWAGRSAFSSFDLPEPRMFVLGAAVVLVLAVIMFAIPSVRSMIRTKAVPILRTSAAGVAGVLRNPAKLALLLGGSTLVTLSYVGAVYLSTLAFGGGVAFATVAVIYLAGSAIATAAPTPGGLGALEAALIGGLAAAGMANAVAIPAVFMYRLATFWLPILPGWASFTWMRRADYI